MSTQQGEFDETHVTEKNTLSARALGDINTTNTIKNKTGTESTVNYKIGKYAVITTRFRGM